jgi:hypothetical protein
MKAVAKTLILPFLVATMSRSVALGLVVPRSIVGTVTDPSGALVPFAPTSRL